MNVLELAGVIVDQSDVGSVIKVITNAETKCTTMPSVQFVLYHRVLLITGYSSTL